MLRKCHQIAEFHLASANTVDSLPYVVPSLSWCEVRDVNKLVSKLIRKTRKLSHGKYSDYISNERAEVLQKTVLRRTVTIFKEIWVTQYQMVAR